MKKYSKIIPKSDPLLGRRIALLRGELNQQEFAHKIGIRQGTLSKYEHGMIPPDSVLEKIADIFRCPIEWLRSGTLTPPSAIEQSQLGKPSPLNIFFQTMGKMAEEVPGADAILLRHLQKAMDEISKSPWFRRYGGKLGLEVITSTPEGPYSADAPLWCDLWEKEASPLGTDLASIFPPNGKILDVGCGSGRDVALLCHSGYNAYGIEPDQSLRALSLLLHPELSGRIEEGNTPGLGLPFGGGFDGILCSNLFQELSHKQIFPAALELKSLLRPDGRLLIVNHRRPSEHTITPAPPFTEFSKEEIQFLLECVGFQLIKQWEHKHVPTNPSFLLFHQTVD